ncbi:unnamed protein product [Darwinula stevensoni]|uniref:EF-hand domain-containing protein n=1 Tax=Darwinula stevensoni TaxID=69355 RepID=A0A7R8XEF2_9CRUS|nr:unnamed protein product [Darwinula stevensoni]CAG0893971.1 unnamed protein product [Darwinula stevensoni]
MTPQDFLDSVTEAEPRPRVRRRVLTMEEIEEMRVATPSLRHSNTRFFRTVCSKGIISYTEYLFLLSILTKPASGFQIAFNMFDTDGNKRVDMPEFLVLQGLLTEALYEKMDDRELDDATRRALERIFSLTRLSKQREAQERLAKKGIAVGPEGGGSHLDQAARLLSRAESVPTTLLVHFFGRGGKGELTFDDFKKFMENLQTEVLELEFQEYSRGREVISETDFARILLRYTSFHSNQYGAALGPDEFQRAVKICTGETLSRHLVNVVFQIFDEDGDGQLSYKEFIAIMKDRLHRGFHGQQRAREWKVLIGIPPVDEHELHDLRLAPETSLTLRDMQDCLLQLSLFLSLNMQETTYNKWIQHSSIWDAVGKMYSVLIINMV